MKRKLMAFIILLVLVGSVCGCSQQEAETHETELQQETETDQVEPQQEAVTDSAADSETGEIPSDAADAQGTVEDVQAESGLVEPLESEGRLPDGISQEEWDLVMEDARRWKEENSGSSSTPAHEVQQDEGTLQSTEPQALTDEEVQATLDYFVDTFRDTDAYRRMSERALEYLEKNLNIVKNDPTSDRTVDSFLRNYQNGFLTEEEFLFCLREWVAGGGDLPGVEIYVY